MTTTITALPRGWRRLPCSQLETLLGHLDDSTEEYDAVAYELDMRYSAESDSRYAQALGCARGELPS